MSILNKFPTIDAWETKTRFIYSFFFFFHYLEIEVFWYLILWFRFSFFVYVFRKRRYCDNNKIKFHVSGSCFRFFLKSKNKRIILSIFTYKMHNKYLKPSSLIYITETWNFFFFFFWNSREWEISISEYHCTKTFSSHLPSNKKS